MNAQHVNNIFKNLPIAPSGNRARVFCKDGFNVSIQASQYHYCEPRVPEAEFYSSFELGFPSKALRELEEWSEDADCLGVFGYVPVEEITKVFETHGGVDFERTVNEFEFAKSNPRIKMLIEPLDPDNLDI